MDPRAYPFSHAAADPAERTDALGSNEGVVQNLQTALEELRRHRRAAQARTTS